MKDRISMIVRFILFIGLLFMCFLYVRKDSHDLAGKSNNVQVDFIQTKKDADCILIRQGEITIMIDTGEEEDGEEIVNFLAKNNIETIQYLIFTHPDKDHIGGAVKVFDHVKVEKVIQPYHTVENERLCQLNDRLNAKKVQVICPTHTKTIKIGDLKLLVYPPLKKSYSNTNNLSIATLVWHKEVVMLFTGDSEKKRLDELMQVHWPTDIDLLKIPYHGRYIENVKDFLTTTSPVNAVITSNQADEVIIDTCDELGVNLFYTVGRTYSFVSDGRALSLLKE